MSDDDATPVGKPKHKDFLSAVKYRGKIYYGDGAHADVMNHVKKLHGLSDDDVDSGMEFGQYRPKMKFFAGYSHGGRAKKRADRR